MTKHNHAVESAAGSPLFAEAMTAAHGVPVVNAPAKDRAEVAPKRAAAARNLLGQARTEDVPLFIENMRSLLRDSGATLREQRSLIRDLRASVEAIFDATEDGLGALDAS